MAPKAGLQSRTPESPKISPTPKNPEARKSRLAAAASQQVATQTGCPSRRTRNRRAIRECAERSIRVVTWPPRVNELAQSRLKVKVGLSGALHCNASSAHPIGALDTRTRIEPSRVSFCFLLSAICTLLPVACCLLPVANSAGWLLLLLHFVAFQAAQPHNSTGRVCARLREPKDARRMRLV